MTKIKRNKLYKPLINSLKLMGVIAISIALLVWITSLNQEVEQPAGKKLSDSVLEYEDMLYQELKKYQKEAYTPVVMALMMQESGGRGNDPMQASESYCGEVGCIKDASLSIEQGVKYFVHVLGKADGDIKLALQSYNFGEGFISYVKDRNATYSKSLAISFSQKKYQELKATGIYACIRKEAEAYEACYGDILYVEAVLDYYPRALHYVEQQKDTTFVNIS
ncbi:lysozyme family protein [Saliterribacillus persicus]|uniref:Lysozyme-like protein n=1 Tax=Saliterribacillus persicus TaxID=930114 RepID=A0A368Y161_9BACI|nr:lysozyme family protein [Saliterribacillus persicus]RCW73116.1 lysozyme-like protein [Saliterribacillus persicus]